MALVKLGSTVTGISGTIGGITFSRCNAGTIARPWSRPSNPATPDQQTTRGVVSNWPSAWRALTDGQRADWATLAATPPETDYDPFGNVVLRTGYNWFVRLNTRRYFTAQAQLEDAPAAVTPTAPAITGFTCTVPAIGVGETFIEFADDEFAADEWCVVFLSFSSSIGNPSLRSNRKIIGFNQVNGVTELDMSIITYLRFGVFPPTWLATATIHRQSDDSFRSVSTILQTEVIP